MAESLALLLHIQKVLGSDFSQIQAILIYFFMVFLSPSMQILV
jgi:hypothetical protein